MGKKPDLAALFRATASDTFLGLDTCTDLASIDASYAFIGAPCATPYGTVGAYAQNGSASLRQAIASLSANIDRHIFDLGGPTFPEGTKKAVVVLEGAAGATRVDARPNCLKQRSLEVAAITAVV